MTRFLTAAVGLPIVVAITLWGPDWLFTLLVAAAASVGFAEFLTVTGSRAGRGLVPFATAVAASFSLGAEWALPVLGLAVAGLSTLALRGPVHEARDRIVLPVSGLVYVAVLLGFILLLPRAEALVLLAIVWASDIGAYYGGRLLGRNRLAPKISPGKTIEGAVIGLLAAVAAGLTVEMLVGGHPSFVFAAHVTLVAVFAQAGDLAESALKRSGGVKDSSGLLPGHGGMLDRIDGLLFAGPVFYLLWSL